MSTGIEDDGGNDYDEEGLEEIETRTETRSTSARKSEPPVQTSSTVSTTTRRLRESSLAYMKGASLWDMAILLAWIIVIVLLVVVIVESIFSAIEPESRLLGLWIIFIVLLILACIFTTIITYTRACSCRCRRPSCCNRASSSSSLDSDYPEQDVESLENRASMENRDYAQNTRQQASKPRCGYGCCSCLRKTNTKYSTVDRQDQDIDFDSGINDDVCPGNTENAPDLEQQEGNHGRTNAVKTSRQQRRQKQVPQDQDQDEEEETPREETDYRIYNAEPLSLITDANSARKPKAVVKRTRAVLAETHKVKKLDNAKTLKTPDKSKDEHFISMKQTRKVAKVAPATQSLARTSSDDMDSVDVSPNIFVKPVAINDVVTTPTMLKNKTMKSSAGTTANSFLDNGESHSSGTSSIRQGDDDFQESMHVPSSKLTPKSVGDSPTDKSSVSPIVKPSAGGRKLVSGTTFKSKAIV